jgi:exodeoxyribonuclease-3
MKILSWNVNGLRAVLRKGFLDWLHKEQPDILCIQEIKAHEEQLPEEVKNIENYYTHFTSAERKGYSGVALFSKMKPLSVQNLDIPRFDVEGRTQVVEYPAFFLYNVYFPNGKKSKERLEYKMDFYDAFLKHAERLRKKGKKLVICGDVNTAHRQIDLARPKENAKVSGFLPEERAWIDTFIAHGFIDTFRIFTSEGGHYSWWDYKSHARERNVGWRIDYFFISENLKKQLSSAFISPEVMGSDHCPVGIELQFT